MKKAIADVGKANFAVIRGGTIRRYMSATATDLLARKKKAHEG